MSFTAEFYKDNLLREREDRFEGAEISTREIHASPSSQVHSQQQATEAILNLESSDELASKANMAYPHTHWHIILT